MPYAETSDVQARLGRTLSAEETTQATALLADALVLIKSRIPDLDDQVEDLAISEDAVIMVQANSVVRFLRNPDGYVSETDGDYTYQRNWKQVSGGLQILEHEWALLGVGSGVFLMHLSVDLPVESGAYITDPDNPLFFYAPMFWNPL